MSRPVSFSRFVEFVVSASDFDGVEEANPLMRADSLISFALCMSRIWVKCMPYLPVAISTISWYATNRIQAQSKATRQSEIICCNHWLTHAQKHTRSHFIITCKKIRAHPWGHLILSDFFFARLFAILLVMLFVMRSSHTVSLARKIQ